jgi:hypothetical protein
MSPEAELLQALRAGAGDIRRHSAWLDLFLGLAQSRIDALCQTLRDWQAQSPDRPLPFAALAQADELAGLCAEQSSDSLAELSSLLAQALRRVSAQSATAAQRQALTQAGDELMRQLHQHAAGVHVVTPPHMLAALR